MSESQRLIFIAAILNSAIYLSGTMAIGIALNNQFAWKAALAAVGISFASWVLQYHATSSERLALASVWATAASVIAGAAAGFALLFG